MKSVSHTRSFQIDQPVDVVFPLFSPEGETLWVPDWKYTNVMGTTDLSEDYVFQTIAHDHKSATATWIVKRYNPRRHIVEFYKIEPEEKVGSIRVQCTAVAHEESNHPPVTDVEVTYKYVALSERGEVFVTGFTDSVYNEYIAQWKIHLREYFAALSDQYE